MKTKKVSLQSRDIVFINGIPFLLLHTDAIGTKTCGVFLCPFLERSWIDETE